MTAPPPIRDRARSLGLIALALLALAARRAEGPVVSARASTASVRSVARIGRSSSTIEAGGRRWSYVVHAPRQAGGDRPLPMVLALHGSSGSGEGFLDDAGWAELAGREGVIVVAPDGLPMRPDAAPNRAVNPRIWNSGQHPADRPRSRVDDLAFFDALLVEVAGAWPVDPNRIYVVGHSNGGAMALRLAAERSGSFAAVASVAALRYVDPPVGARAVPILALFGGADPLLPTEGGLSILPWEVRRTPEVLPELKRWAEGLGCPTHGFTFEHFDTVHSYTFPPGRGGASLSMVLLDGHGHAWPGGRARPGEAMLIGPRTDAVDATALIWDFFDRHRLDAPAPGLVDRPPEVPSSGPI
ncbi:alpha/beta hydrolase family esterase [Tautonia plasticadhaerens]|uniref:Alpha/beta hydrolase family protein n=1 Tax=Tautonia plasticadhaerens TaxID=2527974 RepID=A0A518HDV4_9BACT|nr:PHB depolymerase family esterase [Tautonia plasticadhaerens]QDV39038.1 Alpha/beta hydrolase family protein [Tautonia plasticadhaerens]